MSARARLAVLMSASTIALAGCGGNAGEPVQAPASSPAPPIAVQAKPTAQQAARTLLAQLGSVPCWCTAEARARDRLASGKAKKHPDGYTLTP